MTLDHYEIRVGDVNTLGNFVIVSILWYTTRNEPPNPSTNPDNEIFVTAPNMIERLFGLTFPRKVEAARKILQKRAERHLRQYQQLQSSLKEVL